MAKHAIIGAGLGGLYTANRLINNGVSPENILIVDPRPSNYYTRPGHLSREAFKVVGAKIGIPTPHSPACHIKELERLMYAPLSHLNVQFLEEEFIGLQTQTETQVKSIITRKSNHSLGIYQADYVFDCSGRKASVVQAVNAHQQSIHLEAAFETKLLVPFNSIPNHLLAHVVIPNHADLIDFLPHSSEVVPCHIENNSLREQIELRERLIALGWNYEAFPTFYSFNNGAKVCLYMEAPPNLAQNQQEWIRLLLEIYSNGKISDYSELRPSRKYGVKPRIVSFESVPYVLNKVVHQSESLPVVIVGFDAVKGSDYRLADGVISGMACCEYMLKSLVIADGRIQSINADFVEKNTFCHINGLYKENLTKRLMTRQKAIENAFDYFSGVYDRATLISPSLDSEEIQKYKTEANQLAVRAINNQFTLIEQKMRQSNYSELPRYFARIEQNFSRLSGNFERNWVSFKINEISEKLPDLYYQGHGSRLNNRSLTPTSFRELKFFKRMKEDVQTLFVDNSPSPFLSNENR